MEAGRHTFRLKAVGVEGNVSISDEVQLEVPIEGRFQLSRAFPNPFAESSSVTLVVKEPERVRVEVVNRSTTEYSNASVSGVFLVA